MEAGSQAAAKNSTATSAAATASATTTSNKTAAATATINTASGDLTQNGDDVIGTTKTNDSNRSNADNSGPSSTMNNGDTATSTDGSAAASGTVGKTDATIASSTATIKTAIDNAADGTNSAAQVSNTANSASAMATDPAAVTDSSKTPVVTKIADTMAASAETVGGATSLVVKDVKLAPKVKKTTGPQYVTTSGEPPLTETEMRLLQVDKNQQQFERMTHMQRIVDGDMSAEEHKHLTEMVTKLEHDDDNHPALPVLRRSIMNAQYANKAGLFKRQKLSSPQETQNKSEDKTDGPSNADATSLSDIQRQQAKAQVQAYLRVVRNQKIDHETFKAATLRDQPPQLSMDLPIQAASAIVPKGFDIGTAERVVQHEIEAMSRMTQRVSELEKLPVTIPLDLKTKALIEIRAFRLLPLQRELRRKLFNMHKGRSTTGSCFVRNSFKRPRVILTRDKHKTEKMERIVMQDEAQKKRTAKEQFLADVVAHSNEFRTFHQEVRRDITRIARLVTNRVEKNQNKKTKEEERLEKERMKRLMLEDEAGYRALLDKEKDKRLTFLLEQTDQHLEAITSVIVAHQEHEIDQEKKERRLQKAKSAEAVAEGEGEDDDDDDEDQAMPAATSTTSESGDAYSRAHRVQERVTEQPKILVNGTLKSYQMKGLEWLVSLYNNRLNGILADEMGLGKTIQTIALITYLAETKNNYGPFLIIVPLATISNWQLEFDKWAPSLNTIIYKGGKNARKMLQPQIRECRFNVLVTTYEFVIRDKNVLGKLAWRHMIIDEGHRLKNHSAKLSVILSEHYNAPRRLLLTGTPLQNNIPELWALLNFLLPDVFRSVSSFEQWFNAPFAGTDEKVELSPEEKMLVIQRLHKILRPFLLRRLKTQVETELPDKVEYVIKCEMSALQRKIYSYMQKYGKLLTDGTEAKKDANKGKSGRALMNTVMQLRKVCNHPCLFENVDSGLASHWTLPSHHISGDDLWRCCGKFELLDRILYKLIGTGHRILLFSGSTQLMTILEDYFKEKEYRYLRMDGGTKADTRAEYLEAFNAKDSPFDIFIISTRAGGLGLNLQTADTVIIYDSDWNPHQDMQAQARAHRIGQKREVRVLRLMTINSVEEKIWETAKYKLGMDEKVIQAGFFEGKGSNDVKSRNYLQSLLEQDEEEEDDEDQVADEEQLNEMLARSEEEIIRFREMDKEIKEADKAWKDSRRKNRLVQIHELPEWLKREVQPEEEVDFVAEKIELGRGSRERKDVMYTDGLTEAQFLQAVEDGNLEDVVEKKKKRSKRKRSVVADEEGKGDEKRIHLSESAQTELNQRLLQLLERITTYKDEDDREVAEIFLTLPEKEDYPDYYDLITDPISIDMLTESVENGEYQSFDSLEEDFHLMIDNAKTYNEEGSQVYSDAITLMALFHKVRQELDKDA